LHLEEQAEQFAYAHCFKVSADNVHHSVVSESEFVANQRGALGYHVLRYVENAHYDVKRIGEYKHSDEGFEYPFINVESVEIVGILSSTFSSGY